MNTVTVKSQEDFDGLPVSFEIFTRIEIQSKEKIIIKRNIKNSHVVARENSHVEAWGNSHVVARENSHVEAWGNSHVVARENSHVVARENSHVEAWGNSHVVARGNSHVVARGNSHVVARENSHVEAWGNSHVVAWGNSHVVAWGRTSIQVQSSYSSIILFAFSVAIISKKFCKKMIKKKSKTAYIQEIIDLGWLENNGIKVVREKIVLFKKVSKEFQTQEGTQNETNWIIGKTIEHPCWNPTKSECGEGKFHAVSNPYFGDKFRNKEGDRYIAIKVDLGDIHEWENPTYPHKIAFRKCKVLHECDKWGNKIGVE